MAKKVWFFCRHFPPAVSGGARRPYLLAKALGRLGVQVVVAAPALPDDIDGVVVSHNHPDPAATSGPPRRSLRDLARDWVLWPDPDIRWTRRAARAMRRTQSTPPDWVVSTSPPESIHAAGFSIKRDTGARWLADMRDEWLARPFRSVRRHPARAAMERRLAKRWLQRADLITCVDDVVADEMRALAPQGAVHVLGQFADPPPAPERMAGPGPHILYTGSFSLSDPGCAIGPTLDAFAAAFSARHSLRLHLIGRLTEKEEQAVTACPAREGVKVHGPQPYHRTRSLQAGADAFIVTGAPDATAIPGKVFEYRTVGAPIIAIGEGPWRSLGGYDPEPPVQRMIDLAPFDRTDSGPANPPWSSDDAARRLLALMDAAEAN